MTDEDILLPKDESKPLDLGEIPEALPKTQVDQEKLLGFWLKAFEITTNGARKSAPDLKSAKLRDEHGRQLFHQMNFSRTLELVDTCNPAKMVLLDPMHISKDL